MAVQAALHALDEGSVEKTVIVPVIGPSRTVPDGVTNFIEPLKPLQKSQPRSWPNVPLGWLQPLLVICKKPLI